MQTITISGNIGKDASIRQTQGGDDICSFSVAVKQGFKDDAPSVWYRCNVWGKRGRSISQYLLKGVKAVVQGELTIGTYEGKPTYDVRVNEVEWERRSQGENRTQPDPQTGSAGQSAFDPDLEDDVPFLSPYPHRERRVS